MGPGALEHLVDQPVRFLQLLGLGPDLRVLFPLSLKNVFGNVPLFPSVHITDCIIFDTFVRPKRASILEEADVVTEVPGHV